MWILVILLVLLIASVWVAWALLGVLLVWPIVATGVLVFGLVGALLFNRILAARKASALQQELERQASKQAGQVGAERRPELEAIRRQMSEAIETLKRSKSGSKAGRGALYSLPWYAIVGPPAAGKTTAIRESGLGFAGGKSKVRGTAGTRNCDWWFSRDAILLDTAGRFATEDDDQAEWFTFLDTLRKFRPKRPLDGLLVAVGVSELLTAQASDIEELANKLRERVDEVTTRIEMVLPVYVLFTKTDLVGGFVEFWGDLTKQQRGQAWGATFALDADVDDKALACANEFDVLVDALHEHLIQRLTNESQAVSRSRILQFLVEFQNLKAPVVQLVEQLCQPNIHVESPILRGFYFCSGAQVGNPLDRVVAGMLRGFDLQLAPAQSERVESRSYFVADLFQRVVFADRDVATRSKQRHKRRLTTQLVVAGATTLTVVAFLLPAMLTYAGNRSLVAETVQAVDTAQSLAGSSQPNAGVRAVELLAERVGILEVKAGEFSFAPFVGNFAAAPLLHATKAEYVRRLRGIVEVPVREGLTSEVRLIETLGNVNESPEQFNEAYARLKLYLLMGEPERLREGAVESVACNSEVLEWASKELSRAWLRAAKVTETKPEQLQSHACYYLQGLASDPTWAWKLDRLAVGRAQNRLASVPADELRYLQLLEFASDAPPIRPEHIFLAPGAKHFRAPRGVEVPGVYTAQGWLKVRPEVTASSAKFRTEPWVLGRTEQDGANSNALLSLYFERYEKAWRDFIKVIQVQRPETLDGAIAELRELSSRINGPYTRLFGTLGQNLRLELEAPKAEKDVLEVLKDKGEAVLGSGPKKAVRKVLPVEEHFAEMLTFGGVNAASAEGQPAAASGLQQYLQLLTTLEVDLTQLAKDAPKQAGEFKAKLEQTAAGVRALIGGLEPETRALVSALLLDPILGSTAVVDDAQSQALNDTWRTEVWEVWNATLAKRYPFNATGADASAAELGDFFRPTQGLLWTFVAKNLAGQLEGSSNGYVPRGEGLNFRGDFLACLKNAQAVTDALFGSAPDANMRFTVNILPSDAKVAMIALTVDGSTVTYQNEPERWQPVVWPGGEGRRGAQLKVNGDGLSDEVNFEGEFGLFRLLTAGKLRPSSRGSDVFHAKWSLSRPGDPPVSLELRPAKAKHPFAVDFFRRVNCPAAVVAGRGP